MTVFVDLPIFPFRGQMYCHMATDGEIQELHEMADRIGIKRSWFQNKPGHPHYDLSPLYRAKAIQYGAIEVTSLELAQRCFRRKGKQ